MIRSFCLYAGLFLLLTVAGYGQGSLESENIVVFDPLFWKHQLKLDDLQCRKIREINSEYYEQLSVVIHERNLQTMQAKAAQSLLQRSEEIWETFHPRQRKRWKKMWQQNYVARASSDS